MTQIIHARYTLRTGTTAEWAAHDEVLAAGEVGEEVTTTGQRFRKVGNGVDAWSALLYRINDISDESVVPTDGQVRVWNATNGRLEWGTPASGGASGVNTQTGTAYTFVLGDDGFTVIGSNSGAIAFTIPANADVAFPIGAKVAYTQGDVGQVTISGDTGVTVHDANGNTTGTQWDGGVAEKIGTDEWQLWNGPALGSLATVNDAPSDSKIYGRKNGTWAEATGGGGGANPSLVGINDQTGTTYTLVLSDAGKDVRCTNGSAITLTVPLNSTVAFPTGTLIAFSQGGAGIVTAAAASGVTINAKNGVATTGQYDARVLEYLGSNAWRVW